MSKLSKMTIITANPNTLAQDANPICIHDPSCTNESDFFNEALKQIDKNCKYVGFLSAKDNFTTTDAVEQIEQIFDSNKLINGIYCDNVILPSGVTQFFPAYTNELVRKNYIINAPLFIRVGSDVSFNPQIKYLLFYDLFKRFAMYNIMYHLPETLIETVQEPIDISKELDIIHAKLP